MDPATLASSVLAALTPYLVKGAKQVLETAGEVAHKKLSDLLATLKAKFSGDKEAEEDLEKFEEKPERYRPVIEDILKEKLGEDEDFAAAVAGLVDAIRLEIVQIIKEGKDVTGLEVDELLKGNVSIIQKMDKAESVTGGKFKRIG